MKLRKLNKDIRAVGYAGSIAVLILFVVSFSIMSFAFYGDEITDVVFTNHQELISPSPEPENDAWWTNIPFVGDIVSGIQTLWSWITLGFDVVATLFTFNIPGVPFFVRLIIVIPIWTLVLFILFDLITKAIGSVAGAIV